MANYLNSNGIVNLSVTHKKKTTAAAERRLSKCAQYKLMQCVCVCGVYCNFLAICALKSSIHVLNCGCIASSLENNVEWNGISVILISKQINQFELECIKKTTHIRKQVEKKKKHEKGKQRERINSFCCCHRCGRRSRSRMWPR